MGGGLTPNFSKSRCKSGLQAKFEVVGVFGEKVDAADVFVKDEVRGDFSSLSSDSFFLSRSPERRKLKFLKYFDFEALMLRPSSVWATGADTGSFSEAFCSRLNFCMASCTRDALYASVALKSARDATGAGDDLSM